MTHRPTERTLTLSWDHAAELGKRLVDLATSGPSIRAPVTSGDFKHRHHELIPASTALIGQPPCRREYPYKRSHLVALRSTKISANDPRSTWWPGER
jgi:hypothetical protein